MCAASRMSALYVNEWWYVSVGTNSCSRRKTWVYITRNKLNQYVHKRIVLHLSVRDNGQQCLSHALPNVNISVMVSGNKKYAIYEENPVTVGGVMVIRYGMRRRYHVVVIV